MVAKSELEELVEFLHHGNTQIRQIATENLACYSISAPAIFKHNDLEPIKDLKLLVKDYAPIAHHALIILINLTSTVDARILHSLIADDAFLDLLFTKITAGNEKNANEIAMLLANLVKSAEMKKLLSLERTKKAPAQLSQSTKALDQLFDCFVKGADGKYNPNADFDYLAYVFADLSKYEEGQKYFTTAQSQDDNIVPLSKLVVFTEHASAIRRRGVASTFKNIAFSTDLHPVLMAPVGPADNDEFDSIAGVNLLPYILLPLMGAEDYDEQDSDGMLDDVQLLPDDKTREAEPDIIAIHLDTLLLLTSTKAGRQTLRRIKLYPIIRELHMKVEDDTVREFCDRVVQILVRDDKEVPGIEEEDVLATPGVDADKPVDAENQMEML